MQDYLLELGSSLPTPGGGSAAGVSAAMGAALGRMVAELTIGKKKYQLYEQENADASAKLRELMDRFLLLSQEDAAAYQEYLDAASMPKASDAEIQSRRSALEQAIRHATAVPCSLIETGLKTIEVLESLHGKSNMTCVSDLAAGASELETAAKIAFLNILSNLPYYSDREQADSILEKQAGNLQTLTDRCDALYRSIRTEILNR